MKTVLFELGSPFAWEGTATEVTNANRTGVSVNVENLANFKLKLTKFEPVQFFTIDKVNQKLLFQGEKGTGPWSYYLCDKYEISSRAVGKFVIKPTPDQFKFGELPKENIEVQLGKIEIFNSS